MTSVELPDGAWPVMVTPFREDRSVDWRGVDALTDWYLAAGVAGLFAVAQTSEMYALSQEERVALARRVVDRVAGRVPVVAAGTFGSGIEQQAASVRAIADTGVDAVIAVTSQVAAQFEGDRILEERLLGLVETSGVALGLYECPVPYKRPLAPEVLGALARSGGFVFLKDTTERPASVAAKVAAAEGTPLKIFNAEMSSLLETLHAGAHGFSGNAGSYYPELVQWLCDNRSLADGRPERLQRLLTVIDAVVSSPLYPASAKVFLATARGVEISPVCRVTLASPGEHDRRQLEQLDRLVRESDLPVALA